MKDEVVKEGIIKIGPTSSRTSGKNDGVYWEDLGSLRKKSLTVSFSEGGYVFLYFHNDGQTSKFINENSSSKRGG